MEDLLHILKQKNMTIGTCESLTAGLFCAEMASYPGASKVLKGGIVTYQTEIKQTLVMIDASLIAQEGVVSAACAKAMAQHTRTLLDCDICVSFTGNAGPNAMEGKPVGCVFCGIADRTHCEVIQLNLSGERNEVRQKAVDHMVEVLKAKLMQRR